MSRARRLAVALHAVATSPAMPGFQRYAAHVDSMPQSRTNPPGAALGRALARVASRASCRAAHTSAVALLTGLVSFVDDHGEAVESRIFRPELALRILRAFEGHRALTVPAQLVRALGLAEGRLFDAVLGLHTATRVLARGRDARLHPDLALSLDERLARGRAIAPFHPDDARGGDALGDTYHYWANVAAGLFAASGRPSEARRHVVGALLYCGPVLMRTVRQGIFGSVLFYGAHARVDRLGLAHGRALALEPRPASRRLGDVP